MNETVVSRADNRSMPPGSPDSEAYDWLVRFASGAAGPSDIEGLKRWAAQNPLHAAAFDRASRTWRTVGPAARDADQAMFSTFIRDCAVPKPSAPSRFGRRAFLGGALAASAAAATVLAVRPPLDLWPSLSELAADYRTDVGERRHITPFENVAIEMNTRTSMAVLPPSGGAGRIELLSGEALVSAPSQNVTGVTVVAGAGTIAARDARFNVRRDAASVCVTCLDGEIRVQQHALGQTLTAGRQLVYSEGGLGATSVADASSVTAWQDGLLIFQATPVSDVIVEVNRYRRGRIVLTNAALGRERLSARFRTEGAESIVDQIQQIFGASVTKLPGGVVLIG